jgi:threonine dehydratase
VRGALAKLIALGADARGRGVVAASSGNHGLGVAYALNALGGRGIVFVPAGASAVKVAAIGELGVQIRHSQQSMGDTETIARRYAIEHELEYVSPYNDLDVIAGQGSIGLEIAEQASAEGVEVVMVAVGGGGLAAGVAAAIKSRLPSVRVIGASPVNDAAMAASVRAGRIVEVAAMPTLSDGTAGGIEAGAITFGLCSELIDDWVLVTEEEIRESLRIVIDTRHELIEGAAAVAVAGAVAFRAELVGKRVAVISCGANIAAATLARALH